ncbi:hypothetical protein ACO0K1_03495, partial [Undibacterium sp. SXout20W]
MSNPGYLQKISATQEFLHDKKQNPSLFSQGGVAIGSLTITYFHTGCSTIIGAESFHGPVRDG